jgi:N-acetylglucosamine-6-phosphate deacetylase
MKLGVAAAFVSGAVLPGDVVIEDGVVARVGVAPAGTSGLAVPGFIDLQVNGFAGVDFSTADVEGYRTAGAAMATTGVTAYQPTFICMPWHTYEASLAVAAEAQDAIGGPHLIGVHLEGPFLSPVRHGAHDRANIQPPDPSLLDLLLDWGPVTTMTLAPEVAGALSLIDRLVGDGVVVSCGHSDADAAAAHAAFDRGATLSTHLFNAQRPWHHRDPGISGASLYRDNVVVSVILDGHHLAPETVTMIRRCAPGRVALITDAIAAAGRPDGHYALGDREVAVAAGLARLDDGTIAGSVLTMDLAVRAMMDLGAPLEEAVGAATTVPAAALRRPDLGSLVPGSPADVAIVDDSMAVIRTLVRGVEVHAI